MRIGINGAGVAGPTLAYWLKRWGHEPVLFEQAEALRTGGYVIDFWGLGYECADKMGILPELHEKGYAMRELREVDGDGKPRAAATLDALRDVAAGRFVSLSRGDVAATIYAACGDVETRFGVSIDALEQRENGVDVVLCDGTRDAFDLVVGADGLHSRVRSLAFAPESECEVDLGCRVAAFRIAGYRPRDELTYVMHTEPGRQVARISLRGDATMFLFIWRSAPGSSTSGGPESAKARLRERFADMGWEVPGILGRLDEVDQLYLDRVSQIRLDSWTKGRVALVGDAAACVSLLAGEGTGLAMTEAYVLAGELHRCGGDHVAALRGYEEKLHGLLVAKQRSALRNMGFFAPKSRTRRWLRDRMVGLMARPFVARQLLTRAFREDFTLPSYEQPGGEATTRAASAAEAATRTGWH